MNPSPAEKFERGIYQTEFSVYGYRHPIAKMVSLVDLPNEILVQICSSLCLHCQLPRVVDAPSAVVAASASGKGALSQLSLCSKTLRRAAQPVLFHWYHSRPGDDYHAERRRVASFVFAVLRRPELVTAVQALSLHEPPFPLGRGHAYDTAQAVHDVEGLFKSAAGRIGGHLLKRYSNQPSLEFIQELAIAITPRLSQLCLKRKCEWSRPDEECWTGWSYDMPTLRCLVFEGAYEDPKYEATYHIFQAKSLLRHTPNLQVLIAPDCAAGSEDIINHKYRSQPWDVPLKRLTTLSLNGSHMQQVAMILRECPILEDLEYFDNEDTPLMALDPERHLNHLKPTLRRLCYSMYIAGPRDLGDYDASDPDATNEHDTEFISNYSDWLGGLTRMDTVGLSFASFHVLEVLELEQLLLYGPVFPTSDEPAEDRSSTLTTTDQFLGKMPPSIRYLRVSCILYWPTLYRDLTAFIEHSSRFPRLKVVQLEVFENPPQEEVKLLTDRFRDAANVKVSIYCVGKEIGSRGLLPARPGHKQLVLEPLQYS